MTALWLAPNDPLLAPSGRPDLQLVRAGTAAHLRDLDDLEGDWSLARLTVVGDRVRGDRPTRRTSPAVRRRRTLMAVIGMLLIGLALPLGGTGGASHPTGSALAGTGRAVGYTVQPGDTLWSIAQRVDPNGDPRPLVTQLADQIGSDAVTPGEHLVLP